LFAKAAEESEEGEEQSEEEPPRGTQRQRVQAPADDDSDEESDIENGGGIVREDLETTGEENGKNQFVKKLVRYALACEYARLPIRREGIKDKG
jgi:melanoma-associated antigen